MPFDDTHSISDDALVALYAQGDERAARLLAARLMPRVLSFATRMLGDRAEAEDVTQEAMLRLWRAAPGWQEGAAKVSTWVFKVAANLCTDRLRKKRGVGLDTIAEPEDPAPSVAQTMDEATRAQALSEALENLPDRQRQAVVLRHIEGLTNPEIAEVMDISVEAVESLTARGKRSLSARLLPRKEELGQSDE